MTNIVTANLAKSRFYRCPPLYQYNYGMVLRITGVDLPDAYEVDFANDISGSSITQVGNANGVTIPSQYFVPGQAIYCWLRVHPTQDSGVTTATIVIPISPRATITDEEPTPEEQSAIDEAIAALNDAVDKAEDAVEHYPTITGGIWYVWDVDAGEYVSTGIPAQGAQGNPGKNGNDGISPTVTVAPISGGHRITITDANGTHTVDVLDGENGDAGRGIVSVQKTGTAGLVDTYTITYTDSTTSTFTVTNGQNGTDGISPSITVTDITGGHRVTITDAEHPTGQTFDVMNGQDGQPGTDGTDGVGVPAGGAAGQVLAKSSGADYSTEWVTPYTGTITETVSGATPTITAQDNHRYVCGEVSTLDITLPSSGIVDVVFQSGSTATVLTITPPTGVTEVEWADGFDPDNLSANATYWIKIIDGKLGVATAWGVQSGGGGEKPWNHVNFEVTDASEQTSALIIPNNNAISEILVKGKALFDSYDGIFIFINDVVLLTSKTAISSTNCFFQLYGRRIAADQWIGRGDSSQWGATPKLLDNNATIATDSSISNGVGNIKIASRWTNKIFQVGTTIDVYWR